MKEDSFSNTKTGMVQFLRVRPVSTLTYNLVLRTTCLAKVTLFREYVTSNSIYALATVYRSLRLLCTNFSTSLRRIVPSKLVCLDVDDDAIVVN